MLEDLLYEILPVAGFASSASSLFIIIVMRKSQNAFKFALWLAISDLLLGLSSTFGGFHGVVMTIYGDTSQMIQPSRCLFRAPHLVFWILSDIIHIGLLAMFVLDRLLQMSIPVIYGKVCPAYMNWFFFLFLMLVSASCLAPSAKFATESRDNTSIVVPVLCHLSEVVGLDYYSLHIQVVQWMPVIGMVVLCLVVLIFFVRQTRQKWSYNWSEEGAHTKQLGISCFLRCFLSTVSIHLPLYLIASEASDSQLVLLSDYLVRISFLLVVSLLQPLFYCLAMPVFTENVRMIFNQYSLETKRQWQSASDPPLESVYRDAHGDRNPFGSWYSSAGNVTGEAGLPIEERAGRERSISFYHDKEEQNGTQNTHERAQRQQNGEDQKRGERRHRQRLDSD